MSFRRDWRAALLALRRLLADHQDTAQVFNVIRALSGRSMTQCHAKLCGTVAGGRIAYERSELAERLMDSVWLDQFGPGSVGAAYRAFMTEGRISAGGLVQVSLKSSYRPPATYNPHPYAWMGRRIRDTHDIWHVLCGYGHEPLGEGCLVAFSYAQTGGLGWALIAIGGALSTRRNTKAPLRRAVWEGYRRGRRAAWLLALDYEVLMNEPLDAARRRLSLTPPVTYDSIPKSHRSSPTRQSATMASTPAEIRS